MNLKATSIALLFAATTSWALPLQEVGDIEQPFDNTKMRNAVMLVKGTGTSKYFVLEANKNTGELYAQGGGGGGPLQEFGDITAPFDLSRLTYAVMLVKGTGTDKYYVLEADPDTGEIPMDGGGGGGGGSGDVTGPSSSVNSEIVLFNGTTGKDIKRATGTGVVHATSGVYGVGTVTVAEGGTNATTASGARTNLGAAASGANSDITSLSNLTTPLSIAQGGTGAGTAAGARTAFGLPAGFGTASQFLQTDGVSATTWASITFGEESWVQCNTGSDVTGDGSFSNPWKTVGYAATQVSGNHLIHLTGFFPYDQSASPITLPSNVALVADYPGFQINQPITVAGGAGNSQTMLVNVTMFDALSWSENTAGNLQLWLVYSEVDGGITFEQSGAGQAGSFLSARDSTIVGLDILAGQATLQGGALYGTVDYQDSGASFLFVTGEDLAATMTLNGGISAFFNANFVETTNTIAGATTGSGTPTIQTDSALIELGTSGAFTMNSSVKLIPGITAGSVLFSASGAISQDNASLFWDDTNNHLGIGTTAPDAPLTIRANDAVPSTGIHVTADAADTVGITVDVGSGTITRGISVASSNGGYGVDAFAGTDGTGIQGTAEGPSSIGIRGYVASGGTAVRGDTDSAGGIAGHFIALTGAYAGIFEGGYVGIGTAAPDTLLHVAGDAHIAGKLTVDGPIDPTHIDFVQIATPSNPASGHNRLYFKSDDKLYKLDSGGTETEVGGGGGSNPVYGNEGGAPNDSVYVKSSGFVGIGTTVPGYHLDLRDAGTDFAQRIISTNGSNGNGALLVNYAGSANAVQIDASSNGNALVAFSEGNGNAVIGQVYGTGDALQLANAEGSFVGFKLSATGVTNYSLTLPNAPGGAGEVMTNDGSGNLTWAAPGGGGMQAFTADGTFNVPAGVTEVDILLIGGGGGGAGGGGGGGGDVGPVSGTAGNAGDQGSAGQWRFVAHYPVSGSYAVIVGVGGTAGTGGAGGSPSNNGTDGTPGTAGSPSYFGDIKGKFGNIGSGGSAGQNTGGAGAAGCSNLGTLNDNDLGIYIPGVSDGTPGTGGANTGGDGACNSSNNANTWSNSGFMGTPPAAPFQEPNGANGGNGGDTNDPGTGGDGTNGGNGLAMPANSGMGGAGGAGGGGGGGGSVAGGSGGNGGNGAAGSDGIVVVWWH